MALGYVTAGDLAQMLLPMHVRGDALAQTIQDKPFLKWWEGKKKTFAGGLNFQLTEGVQGQFMSDTTTLQGYSQDDQLNFSQAMNAQRTSFYGKEHNYGLIITWTELKQDGIHINDKQAVSRSGTDRELYQLMDVLKNRMADFAESYARGKARLFFLDGSQDPKAMAGFKSIIQDTNTVGTVGGISKSAYPWWQNRASLAIQPSGENQTMCRFFQTEMRNLKLFGGKPDKAFCGQDFLNALEMEIRAKGVYTQEGFTKDATNDFGQGKVSLMGLGEFTWEPMLDQLGESKRCYILDSRHIKVRPQEDEDGPAVEFPGGRRDWYLNDKLHREDGPAVEHADGSVAWFLNDKLHREDGPAVEYIDGYKEWCLNGEKVSEDEFKQRLKTGKY